MTVAPVARALGGVRVVALEHAAAGPFGSRLLADAGASVVKIERPVTGDVVRGWDHVVRGMSSGFVWLNRGKASLVLDLKHPEGLATIRRLARGSDVFLTNLGPAAIERLGLSYRSLSQSASRLIYCSISGYGTTGPYRDAKAYDLLIQGESGVLATTGSPDAPAKVGVSISDIGAGVYAALAITLALYEREHTGRGQFIDISMFEVMLDWLGFFPHHFWHAAEEPTRVGMRHHYIVPYGVYVAADGKYVNLAVGTEADWRTLCTEVLDRPDWAQDARFADAPARRANRMLLEPLIEEVFRSHDSGVWFERLRKAGIAHGRVRSMSEVLAHPQLAARQAIRTVASPVGAVPTVESALRMSDSPMAEAAIPSFGGNSVAVLRDFGFGEREIEALQREGVVFDATPASDARP